MKSTPLKVGLLTAGITAILSLNVVNAHDDDSAVEPSSDEGTTTGAEHRPHKGGMHNKHFGIRHEDRNGKMVMKKIDTNEDGKVDLTEYLANSEQRFQTMDSDDDGYVTAQEVNQAGMKMRKQHHKVMKEAHKNHQEHEDQEDSEPEDSELEDSEPEAE